MSSYPNAPMIAVTLDAYMKSNYAPPYLQAVNDGRSLWGKAKWTHNPSELTVCMTSSENDFPGDIDSAAWSNVVKLLLASGMGKILFFDCTITAYCVNSNQAYTPCTLQRMNRSAILLDSPLFPRKITSVEDLDAFAQSLLSRPLLMDAKMSAFFMKHEFKVKVFVYVNTSHPVIKSQILKALNQARHFLSEGQPFSVKINFNSVVAAWLDYCDKRTFRTSYSGTGASIEITNSPFFDDCPGCGSDAGPDQRCLVGCCYFLSCPVSCPIYLIYREMKVASKTFYIQGEVKHVVWLSNSPITADFVELIFTKPLLSYTSVATGVKTLTGFKISTIMVV